MRVLLGAQAYQEMLQQANPSRDCFVRPGEYLHHCYREGVKFLVQEAVEAAYREATERNDAEAVRHLELHREQIEQLLREPPPGATAPREGALGDPSPLPSDGKDGGNFFVPQPPRRLEECGLSQAFLADMVLRALYNRGALSGADLAAEFKLPYSAFAPVLAPMRKQGLIDIARQKLDIGDAGLEYELKPPKGPLAVEEALRKTEYCGPAPVPFSEYVETVVIQTVQALTVTRRSIQQAFADLVVSDAVLNEIGPAVNAAASLFLFGPPGNGKTSIAERITRLLGDFIYVPYAVEANGRIIKIYDPAVHELRESAADSDPRLLVASLLKEPAWDRRYVKVRRPTIIVGGELTLPMLDLRYYEDGKYYEAPLHVKANGGIFMIDDFGRQQVRPADLLNRWIIPLEKRHDYLTTTVGTKLEVPFDVLLIFSTNLDPRQLADEAFWRRIKFKVEIRDPDLEQYKQVWRAVCRSRNLEYDARGIDYLIQQWYRRGAGRPFRMCHPRDLLDQMVNIAKFGMERLAFTPDLIDAACASYFVREETR